MKSVGARHASRYARAVPFPVDITSVRATESKVGRTFPLAFVEAMTANNGGTVEVEPDWYFELHPFLDESSTKRLMRTCNDIVRETRVASQWRGFPGGAVAIGAADGDRLILLPDPDSPGQLDQRIYWWDHETGAVQAVAADFSKLQRS